MLCIVGWRVLLARPARAGGLGTSVKRAAGDYAGLRKYFHPADTGDLGYLRMRVQATAGNRSKGLKCQERTFFSGFPNAGLTIFYSEVSIDADAE